MTRNFWSFSGEILISLIMFRILCDESIIKEVPDRACGYVSTDFIGIEPACVRYLRQTHCVSHTHHRNSTLRIYYRPRLKQEVAIAKIFKFDGL